MSEHGDPSPRHLPVEVHLAGLADATDRLARWADSAGPDARVPPCPKWRVHDLVVHQGSVHRWARAMLLGGDPRAVDIGSFEAQGRAARHATAWLRDGAAALLDTLRSAPDDLDAFTFLADAPPATFFWARRQHQETVVHALDALAALEGRLLTAADAWYGPDVAADGIDELVVGFWQRRRRGPRAHGEPYAVLVGTDEGDRWHVEVGVDAVRTRRLAPDDCAPRGAAYLSGPAADVHLGLWNRGGNAHDPHGVLDRWRRGGAVV